MMRREDVTDDVLGTVRDFLEFYEAWLEDNEPQATHTISVVNQAREFMPWDVDDLVKEE